MLHVLGENMNKNTKANRSLYIIRIHTVLAGFFLPVAIIFAVTGGLYTFGVKGNYRPLTQTLEVTLLDESDLSEVHNAAINIITEEFSGKLPSGSPSIKKVGTSWQFEWTGSRADFTLEPTTAAGFYKAVYKPTTWHRYFVQLHKAKGGAPFKFLAGGLALAFISLFASGVLIAFGRPQLRPLLLTSLGLGTVISVVLAFMS